jgi:superfamily I DNA/RNA helicase
MSLPTLDGRQREVVCLPVKGHNVVLGTAGSGKTTMAIYRADYLAQLTQSRVLLVTYNRALVTYLRTMIGAQQVNPLVEPRTYHHFARGYLAHMSLMDRNVIAEPGVRSRLIEQAVITVRKHIGNMPVLHYPTAFFAEECEWIAGCGIQSAQAFSQFRMTPNTPHITVAACDAIFQVYQTYLALRAQTQYQYDWADVAQKVEESFARDTDERWYGHVVIDEGQDFTPSMLRSLARTIPANGSLTFFGDMAQQIYGNRISWRTAGLHPAGTWEFAENYRNSRQIAELCLAMTHTPAFAGVADLVPPNRFRPDGPPPAIVHFATPDAERVFVLQAARSIHQNQSLAILVRRHADEEYYLQALRREGVQHIHRDLSSWRSTGISVGTYHAAKGMEFDTVILSHCSADHLPDPDRLQAFARPEEGLAQEARILYVGLSRTKTRLIITHTNNITPLLPQTENLYQRFER